MVLDASTKDNGVTLDPLLETIINQLFQMICQPVDPSNTQQIKNQNEILRCFTVLSKFYSMIFDLFSITYLHVSIH